MHGLFRFHYKWGREGRGSHTHVFDGTKKKSLEKKTYERTFFGLLFSSVLSSAKLHAGIFENHDTRHGKATVTSYVQGAPLADPRRWPRYGQSRTDETVWNRLGSKKKVAPLWRLICVTRLVFYLPWWRQSDTLTHARVCLQISLPK